jgi:hypothetical protein
VPTIRDTNGLLGPTGDEPGDALAQTGLVANGGGRSRGTQHRYGTAVVVPIAHDDVIGRDSSVGHVAIMEIGERSREGLEDGGRSCR